MALSGEFKVNGSQVGYWEARRLLGEGKEVDRGPEGLMYLYSCTVILFDGQRQQTWKRSFNLWHYYDAGALVLASKILESAVRHRQAEAQAQSRGR